MLIRWLAREMRVLHQEDEGTTSGGTQEQAAASTETEQASTSDDFDKDRAMATIKSLRAFEKDAKAKLKRLEDLEKADQERRTAEMTEAERLRAELDTVSSNFTALQSELTRRRVLDAARREAEHKKLAFFPDALEDELKLGTFESATVKDDGSVTGLGSILSDLATRKPYLLKPVPRAGDIDAGAKGGTSHKEEDAEHRIKLAERFGLRNVRTS
jgi:hypothetical protein